MNVYKKEELIGIFKTIFEMDITENELQECKPDFVQRIYILFLKDFGAAVERIGQVPFNESLSNVQQYPEMYRSACFVHHLAKVINYYLNLIYSNNDFTADDLFQPEWNRTRKFFSMFVDFYKHLSERLPLYEDIENQIMGKKEKFENVKASIETFKAEIRHREMLNAENEINLEKEMQVFVHEKNEISNIQEMKNRLKGRLEGLNTEMSDLKMKLKEWELSSIEAKEGIEILKSQVVQEGEHLEIEELDSKLSACREATNELRATLKELKNSLQILKTAEETVKSALIPAVEAYEAELQRRTEVISLKEKDTNKISAMMEKDEELARSLQILSEEITLHCQEISRLQNSREVLKKGYEDDIQNLLQTLQELKKLNEQHDALKNDLLTERKILFHEEEIVEKELNEYLIEVKTAMKKVTAEAARVLQLE